MHRVHVVLIALAASVSAMAHAQPQEQPAKPAPGQADPAGGEDELRYPWAVSGPAADQPGEVNETPDHASNVPIDHRSDGAGDNQSKGMVNNNSEGSVDSDPANEPDDILEPDDPWANAIPDRMRGLPACAPGALPPEPGERYTCRPPIRPGPLHWSLGIDWVNGIVGARSMPAELLGSAQGLGVSFDVWLQRWLGAGVRYQLLGFGRGQPANTMANATAVFANDFLAMVKLRGFTDEVDRNAWTLSAGAGGSLRSSELGNGAVACVALSRAGGMYGGKTFALTYAIELAYEHALDDSELRVLLATWRGGLEFGIPTPHNIMELDSEPAIDYTLGVGWRVGMLFGPALDLGLPLMSRAALRFTIDHSFGWNDGKLQGFDGASWGVLGGIRVSPVLAALSPYVEVQGGWDWTAAETGKGILPGGAARGDMEFGMRVGLGCWGATDLGLRLRSWVDDAGIDLRDIGIVFRLEHGLGTVPGRRWGAGRCVRQETATRPWPVTYGSKEPEEPLQPEEPVQPAPVQPAPVHMDGHVDVDAGVEVNIEPVVVEVDIGVVLLGGMVRASIDPRLLPLAQLRQAGFVEVEILGPASALARFEGELRAVLSRERLRVDAWATTAIDGRTVSARFTIWPPAARPR